MNVAERFGQLSTRQKAIAGAVAAVVVAGAATGVGVALSGGNSTPKAAPATSAASTTPTPSPTPTPTPTPKPKPKPPAPINPLTGGTPASGPTVAVKIDDVAAGRPQVGIDKADVVYVEEVEGGLTRLVALFSSSKPTVGPVRSVRASDPELLTQFGPIGFAASGGGGDSLPALDRSILKADINDRGGPGWFRDGSREAPHNLMLNLAQVNVGAAAKSNGWTWSAATTQLAARPSGRSVRTVVGGTDVGFQYDPASRRYVRVIDGTLQHAADGAYVATPNVIVQFCEGYVNPNDIDPAGNPGHYTKSIGRGKVVVFRNGKRIDGTWTRASASGGTVLRDTAGRVIPLAPGGAWVALATAGAPLTSS